MAKDDGLTGQFRHSPLQQHPEPVGLFVAQCPIPKRLWDSHSGDLLSSSAEASCPLPLLREEIFECVDCLPKIVFHGSWLLRGNEGDQFSKRRISERGVPTIPGILN